MQAKRKKALITFVVWILLVAIYILLNIDLNPPAPITIKNLEQLNNDLQESKVKKVLINFKTNKNFIYLKEGQGEYSVFGYLDEEFIENAYDKGVELKYAEQTLLEKLNIWFNINLSNYISYVVPLFIFIIFYAYFIKKNRAQSNSLISLKNSSAKLFTNGTNVSFKDIGGMDDIKEGVQDVLSFLKDPSPWVKGGGKLPRGIILEGAPGTGKTLFARALASECKANFYSISGSEFVELFVGVGAARVRDLFEKAKANIPAVIFIDEIDAIGRKRSVGHGMGSEEWDNTLNQLLSCMDGFVRLDRVLVVAATNRIDILDPALMRAGRFDRSFTMKKLTPESQEQILNVHLRDKKLDKSFSIKNISEKLSGISGAEIETIVNESALASINRYVKEKSNNPSAEISLLESDILDAYNKLINRRGRLAGFDDTLLESDSRFVTFSSEQMVTVDLNDNKTIQGRVVWASPTSIKLKEGNQERVIRKSQIISLRT